MTTPEAWIFDDDCSCTCRPMASRMRVSTSAGPGALEHHIGGAPLGAHRGEAALGEHEHDGNTDAGGLQNLAERPGAREVSAAHR